MRQLNYIKPGVLEWHEVPEPSLPSEKGALVRPCAVSTCDFDGLVIGGLAPFKGPLPVGHEGVGEVVDVGAEVRAFAPGDRVVIPWKISCGECAKCRMGLTAHCLAVPFEAAYSWGPTAREWGGFLADLVAVPWADHMLCPLPAGVDPFAAAPASDNLTDSWRAVGPPLRLRPGGRVLVAGGGGPGSIGLCAAGLARAAGAGEITYMDWDAGRRELAAARYAATPIDSSAGLPERDAVDGEFDVLVDASGNPAALPLLVDCAASNAIITCTAGGFYFRSAIPFSVYRMYRRSISFHTGWVHTRPLMEEPLALVADGAFDPRAVETACVPFDDAVAALTQPFTKLTFSADA